MILPEEVAETYLLSLNKRNLLGLTKLTSGLFQTKLGGIINILLGLIMKIISILLLFISSSIWNASRKTGCNCICY